MWYLLVTQWKTFHKEARKEVSYKPAYEQIKLILLIFAIKDPNFSFSIFLQVPILELQVGSFYVKGQRT